MLNPRSHLYLHNSGLTAGLLAIITGACFTALPAISQTKNPPSNSNTTKIQARAVTPRGPLLADEQRIVTLFETSSPSVAYITTEVVQTDLWQRAEVSQGAGSGFVWDAAGHVVTNNHVVQNARRVFVQLIIPDRRMQR